MGVEVGVSVAVGVAVGVIVAEEVAVGISVSVGIPSVVAVGVGDQLGEGVNVELEVDGGISPDTIGRVSAAGADVFVAGSAIYYSEDYEKTIRLMRERMSPVS